MRRRLKPVDPVPDDLATFRLESWLVLVDPAARLPADDGRSCSDEHYRREEARRLWVRARTVWADRHEWPGGLLAKLTEERDVRRRLAAATRTRGETPPC